MSGVTVATIEQVDRRGVDARHRSSARCAAGTADVGQRLVVGGDAALADARAVADPLVVRVDQRRELVVRQDALGDVAAEAP